MGWIDTSSNWMDSDRTRTEINRPRPLNFNQHRRDSSSSSKIGLSTATAACCCCCLSFGLFLLALPPSPSAVAQAFHLPSLQPPRPTTTFVGGCFIAPTRRPGAGRRRLLPGSLPPRALLAAATTEPPHVAPPPPAAAAAAAAAQPAAHDAAVDAATTPSTDGGRSGLTAALDALALKGRHQEALALLRSARDGSHPLFGPGEVGPVQYHKVGLGPVFLVRDRMGGVPGLYIYTTILTRWCWRASRGGSGRWPWTCYGRCARCRGSRGCRWVQEQTNGAVT